MFFVLNLIQARNPDWVKKPFFAKYDENATWLSQLKPALGHDKFFYQDELNQIIRTNNGQMFFNEETEADSALDMDFEEIEEVG